MTKPAGATFAAHRPTARQFFTTVLVTGLALAVVSVLLPPGPSAPWLPEPEPDLEWTLILSGAGMLLSACILLLFGYQGLAIDGSAIRLKRIDTRYRWRSFDARDVKSIRYSGPGFQRMDVALTLHLAPSGDGRPRAIGFATVMWWSESAAIDNPVFRALVTAVARVQPDIVVEGLPADYDGPLRAPSLLDAVGPA